MQGLVAVDTIVRVVKVEASTEWWQDALPAITLIAGVILGGWLTSRRGNKETMHAVRVNIFLNVLPPFADAVNGELRRALSAPEPQPIPKVPMEDQFRELDRYAVTASKADAVRVKRFHRLWNELWWNRDDYVAEVQGKNKQEHNAIRDKRNTEARDLWTKANKVLNDYTEFLERKLMGWRGARAARRLREKVNDRNAT